VLEDSLQVFCNDFETFWADIADVGDRISFLPALDRQIESRIYVEMENTVLRTNMVFVVSTGRACMDLNWTMSPKTVRSVVSCIVRMNGEVVG
jgi:hypothetical protein